MTANVPVVSLVDPAGAAPTPTSPSTFGRNVIAVWFVAMSIVGGSLVVRHAPLPAGSVRMSALLSLETGALETGSLEPGTDEAPVRVFHVLYADCRCSKRVVERLAMRGVRRGLCEHVLLAGRDDALSGALQGSGFTVTRTTPRELGERFGIDAAPLLVITASNHTPLYIGGYTPSKQSLDVRDGAILDAALRGERPRPLPVYGCPVSDELRAQVNPLRLP